MNVPALHLTNTSFSPSLLNWSEISTLKIWAGAAVTLLSFSHDNETMLLNLVFVPQAAVKTVLCTRVSTSLKLWGRRMAERGSGDGGGDPVLSTHTASLVH